MNQEQEAKLRDAITAVRERMRSQQSRPPDEDRVLMEALREALGEREALRDPRYYGAWARTAGRGLEEFMDGEFGPKFGHDIVELVSVFTEVGKDEPELLLRKFEAVEGMFERIENLRLEMETRMMARLNRVRDFSLLLGFCRAMAREIKGNVGG